MPDIFSKKSINIQHEKFYLLYLIDFLLCFILFQNSSLATFIFFYSTNFTIQKKNHILRKLNSILIAYL